MTNILASVLLPQETSSANNMAPFTDTPVELMLWYSA